MRIFSKNGLLALASICIGFLATSCDYSWYAKAVKICGQVFNGGEPYANKQAVYRIALKNMANGFVFDRMLETNLNELGYACVAASLGPAAGYDDNLTLEKITVTADGVTAEGAVNNVYRDVFALPVDPSKNVTGLRADISFNL